MGGWGLLMGRAMQGGSTVDCRLPPIVLTLHVLLPSCSCCCCREVFEEEWLGATQTLETDPSARNTALLTALRASDPAHPGVPASSLLLKCMSLAWMHEWLMVESLRRG